jgi:exopolysaccharide production protein ExoY
MSLGASDVSGSLEAVADFSPGSHVGSVDAAAAQPLIRCKRLLDVNVAILALMILAPLLATIALVLLLSQGRPVFIRHRRVGRNGAAFPCFKFRTMVRNADEVLRRVLAEDPDVRDEWQRSRKLRRDPRVTPFGRVLRETSVDEIPQLFNVLCGHMSLVGPRPIVAEEIGFYGAKITQYYKVRPGLTGAWQVGGRSDVSFGRRVELDTAYVASWSFRTDLRILLKTVPVVLGRKGSC